MLWLFDTVEEDVEQLIRYGRMAQLATGARRISLVPREIATQVGRDVKDVYRVLERTVARLKHALT